MASKTAIIGIVAVVIVVAIAAVALGGGSDEKKADVRYDYTLELSDTIPDNPFNKPSEGKTFLLVDYVFANDNFRKSITTNFMAVTWSATVDGLVYSQSSALSVTHPDYQLVDIPAGSKAVSGAVIEVPATATLDGITINLSYNNFDSPAPVFVRDDSLL